MDADDKLVTLVEHGDTVEWFCPNCGAHNRAAATRTGLFDRRCSICAWDLDRRGYRTGNGVGAALAILIVIAVFFVVGWLIAQGLPR